ncbi:hypothetical protein DID80_06890 [Candidatus Marinamargulisbacteria bacterium SCGC AAA071-K20]|nr:hypothetical protein DID80_06890 [Candidatus Marinamargulisbacteria bacterium SCGC AAA071-K20]
MSHYIKVILVLFVLSTTLFSNSFQDSTLVEGFAKAYAITADNSGLETAQKNPAAITFTKQQFSTTYTSYFDDAYKTVNIAYAKSIGNSFYLGFQIPTRLISDIPETIADGNGEGFQIGTFSDTTVEGVLSVGVKSKNNKLRFGSNFKTRYQKLYSQTGTKIGLDLGAQYYSKHITLGASLQEIGSIMKWDTGKNENIPLITNLGIAIRPNKIVTFLADTSLTKTTVDINTAISWKMHDQLTINGGIKELLKTQRLSVGLNLLLGGVYLDYAYSQNNYLGSIHKVGVRINVF